MDPKLGPGISDRPCITFRRTLKNIFVPSKLKEAIKDNIRSFFDNKTGIFRCGKRGCLTCQFIMRPKHCFERGLAKCIMSNSLSFVLQIMWSLGHDALVISCMWDVCPLRKSVSTIYSLRNEQMSTVLMPFNVLSWWRHWYPDGLRHYMHIR